MPLVALVAVMLTNSQSPACTAGTLVITVRSEGRVGQTRETGYFVGCLGDPFEPGRGALPAIRVQLDMIA